MRRWILWQRSALLGANYVRLSEQAVRIAYPAESLDCLSKYLQKLQPIVVKEDEARNESSARTPRNSGLQRVPGINPTGSHMVQRTLKFDSQWTSHGISIAGKTLRI